MTTTAPGKSASVASRHAVPDGFRAVPLAPQATGPLRLCVLMRKQEDAAAGWFVALRETFDATIYLGCIADVGSAVHAWVELWIQNTAVVAESATAAREALNNLVLDERWRRHFEAFGAAAPGAVVQTGWETAHPAPLFIDSEKWEAVNAIDAFSNGAWALCTDDAVLTAKELPKYSSSLQRYLYVPSDPKSPLIPLTAAAPSNANTVTMNEITGPNPALVPLNPGGGLMLVRRIAPVAYEPYVGVLSGGTWEGIISGRGALPLDELADVLHEDGNNQAADGRIFMGAHGKAGRFVEHYHLKLRLIADAIASVRSLTERTQRPILNLTAGSFQVALGDPGRGLPYLWTARVVVGDPGDAVALKLPVSDATYFVRAMPAEATAYQPQNVSQAVTGRGTARIRKTLTDSGGTIIEGTLATQEKLDPARSDLVHLRVSVGGGRADLLGHVERDNALAAGEWRFRTGKLQLPEPMVAQLKAAEGVPLNDVQFELIPLLSSPVDAYALAVLAIRTLLVNPQTTLAIAVDEVLSLARQVAVEYNAETPLPQRIRAIFERDRRFVEALGAQRLVQAEMPPQEAFDLVPPELWLATLALILRLLPGLGPDSYARDFGDAQVGGLHRVYDQALAELDKLLVRSRSMIVIDWRYNREIHAVLRQFSTGLAGAKA
jgi:hypothetical protein